MKLPRKSLFWAAVVLAFLTLWAGAASIHFLNSDRTTRIGPFTAVVSPSWDSHVTFKGGALLPAVRLPSNYGPLGVDLNIEDLEGGTLGQAVTATAVVASSPEGEIANMKSVIVSMAKASLLFGFLFAAASFITLRFIWLLIGETRRKELRSLAGPQKKQMVLTGAVLLTVLMPLPLLAPSPANTVKDWTLLREIFPELPTGPRWAGIEVEASPLTGEVENLVRGAINAYKESLEFYGDLADTASMVEGLRQPVENEHTALIVTDRHDNTPMDQVAKAIGDRVNAEIVLDLGDDTSTGGRWELFSINSLVETYADYKAIVAVPGNHDNGPYVAEALEDRGVHVLRGTVQEIEGLTLLGEPDPRATEFGRGYLGDGASASDAVRDVDERLTNAACTAQQDGVNLTAVLIHAPSAAETLTSSGCAPLVLSGHLHRQVGPERLDGPYGQTISLTTGTSGGAAYAFALGSKLRREAQVSLLTYDDSGKALGLQVVTFTPGGQVIPQPYFAFSGLLGPIPIDPTQVTE